MSVKRLHRSKTNRMLGGIAGGIAEYFELDPTLVRVIWLIMIPVAGLGPLFYLLCWVIIPPAP